MSTTPHPPADADEGTRVPRAQRVHLSEDWLATIVGLVLLGLVLAGVIGDSVVP